MSGLAVDVLGTAMTIAAPAPLQAELAVALADLQPAEGVDRQLELVPTDGGFDLREDGRVIRRCVDPAVAAATVVWRLNIIAGEATEQVLLHAAAVAGPEGGAVLLPGGTGAGKSTLAAASVGGGLTYVTDELVAVDRGTGLVKPYAKPLGLDGERLVPASSLGAVATEPVTPSALVFPRYAPGASLTEAPLDVGWTLLALASHAINPAALGATALAWLAGLALACPALQLTHGDAPQAVAAVERAAARPHRPVQPARVLDPITPDTTTVALDDALAVLHEPSDKVHVLNPSAAAVWRRATGVTGASDVTSLVDAVLDGVDGERTDRSTAAATIDRLTRVGLLAAPSNT